MFKDRRLVIASKHAKEQVLAPLLEAALGVRCEISSLDTDLLGTFTGEVERTLSPLDAAREKCRRAMDASDCRLAVASEGSFGPHPAVPMVPADDELLLLVDRDSGAEFVVREISTATNFASRVVSSEVELLSFAERAGFPAHGLILRAAAENLLEIKKGITSKNNLLDIFNKVFSRHGQVLVETDMRANFNPSRMAVIRAACEKLLDQLNSRCPRCDWPGFVVTEVKRGLPCGLCGLPTRSVSRALSRCQHCDYLSETRFPDGKTVEDPTYCEYCNP